MSRLTTKTKIVYVAVYYTEDHFGDREFDNESCEYSTEEACIANTETYLSVMNEEAILNNRARHYTATIEKRIVPVYE